MLLVITGPSGTGKTTLIRRLLRRCRDLAFSVSHTTRPPRPGEVEGKDYYFVSEAEFLRLLKKKTFVEWAVVHGYYYGTSKEEFKKSQKQDLVMDIDVQGARQVKKLTAENGSQAVFVFILPPNRKVLEERLLQRGDLSPQDLRRRVKRAREEIKSWNNFEYLIVNHNLEEALAELKAIVVAERCRSDNKRKKLQPIINSFR
ncbi:MAG: guanylate kinase [Candidatus Aminicenantales bacterium]